MLEDGYEVTADDCKKAAKEAGIEFKKGDVVCVNMGRMNAWPDFDGYLLNTPGIGLGAAKFLCEEAGAMCIAGDTIGLGSGTVAGQGHHGMSINDIVGTDFITLSGINALVRASGDIIIPVELMTFSVE